MDGPPGQPVGGPQHPHLLAPCRRLGMSQHGYQGWARSGKGAFVSYCPPPPLGVMSNDVNLYMNKQCTSHCPPKSDSVRDCPCVSRASLHVAFACMTHLGQGPQYPWPSWFSDRGTTGPGAQRSGPKTGPSVVAQETSNPF